MAITVRTKLVTALGSAALTYIGFAFVSGSLTPWDTDPFTRFMMLGVFVGLYGSSLACAIINHDEGWDG